MANKVPMSSRRKKGLDNHVKGLEFEQLFAEFMRTHLGLHRIKGRWHFPAKRLAQTIECDLLAGGTSQKWLLLTACALMIFAFFVIIALATLVGGDGTNAWELARYIDSAAVSITPQFKGWGLAAVVILAEVFVLLGIWRSRIHIWAECKDKKARIDRGEVFKVHARIDEARGYSRRANSEVWLVSASGFEQDALTAADERRIICIQFNDGKATIMNDMRSQVPGFQHTEPSPIAKPPAALWFVALLVPLLIVTRTALSPGEPWWCVCYERVTTNGAASMTACRRSPSECETLRRAVMHGTVKGTLANSALDACVGVEGEHPGDNLGGRSVWEDSMRDGAYISRSGCLLK